MATRSLGQLTLDLIAKTGSFVGPLDDASRRAKKAGKEMANSASVASKAWKDLGPVISTALAGLSAGTIASSFIRNTMSMEKEQAQLAAVLRSTGQAAGYTREQLNEMATAMEGSSTYASGEVTQAQTTLLAFTNVVGKEFPRAMQAVLDMSARTGMGLVQTAETIGRALDVPSQGMAALSRQGFRFTEDQKKLMKELEATGRTAEAQGIILKALEDSYGGAAVAAANTLGGALVALKNTINSLMTGDEGTLSAATRAVQELNEALRSPEGQRAVEVLTDAVVVLSTVLAARLAVSFVAARVEAVKYQLALATMAGHSARAAMAITATATAARAAAGAMALLGGPVGIAITAAGALTFFAMQSNDASQKARELKSEIDELTASFLALSVAEIDSEIAKVQSSMATLFEDMKALNPATKGSNPGYGMLAGLSEIRKYADDVRELQQQLDKSAARLAALGKARHQLTSTPDFNTGVTDAESTAFEDMNKRIRERIVLIGKTTEAEQFWAKYRAGFIDGLTADEAELLLQEYQLLDAAQEADRVLRERKSAEEANAKAVRESVAALKLEASQLALTDEQKQLAALESKGATEAQLEEAAAALELIRAYEQQRKSLEELDGVRDFLLTEEERVRESYARRRQIILDATEETSEARAELLRRLEEKESEELLKVSENFWHRWLANAKESLTNLDDLTQNTIENLTRGFGNALEAMVFDSGNAREAFQNLFEGVARSSINALGQMIGQWLAYQAVQKAVGQATQTSAAAAMIGNATAAVNQAGINAYASTAAIPIVGPGMAPAAMAAAIAATAPLAATVATAATSGLVGMAHEGLDVVPKTGTWLLEKGERVTTAETSAKLDRTLEEVNRSTKGPDAPTLNIVVNAEDPGAEARIRSMIQQEMVPQIIKAARDNTVAALRRPRFA